MNDILNDLIEMVYKGQTAVALSRRYAYIETQNITVYENEQIISPLLQYVFTTYWYPLIASINRNFCIIAKSPYYFTNVTFQFEGKTYNETIPIGLNPGYYSYTIKRNVSVEGDTKEEHIFTMLNCNTSEQPEIFFVSSRDYHGWIYNTDMISSEYGQIREEWLRYKIQRSQTDEFRKNFLHQPIYLEKVRNPTTEDNQIITARIDEHINRKHDEEGMVISEGIQMGFNKEQQLYSVPDQHRISTYQPQFHHSLLSVDEKEFEIKVDKALGLPFSDFYAGKGVFSSKVVSEVDQARASLSAKLSSVASDYSNALKTIWKKLYKTDVNITIGFRSQVDTEMIQTLRSYGYINDEIARKEMLTIAGIHHDNVEINEQQIKKQRIDKKKALKEPDILNIDEEEAGEIL